MRRARAAVALALALALPESARGAGEDYYEENPAPAELGEIPTSFEPEPREERRPVVDAIRRALETLPFFSEDGALELKLRSYYLYGKLLANERRETWAYGGTLRYDSGWWRNRVGLELRLSTSQPLHAPSDRDGARLLRPRQRQYAVLDRSALRVRLADGHELRLYRQGYELPFLNEQDSRMTPNAHEGYSLHGSHAGNGYRLRYVGGYVARMKERDSDRFRPMGTVAAPEAEPKRGLWMGGAAVKLADRFEVGAIHYHSPDVLDLFYTAADASWLLSDELALRLRGSYTDQRSTGDDLLTGAAFDTHQTTLAASTSFRAAILHVAVARTGGEAAIRSPWGSRPSPLSLMLNDFDRAGEDAWLVGVSYNGTRLGLERWSAFANFARGSGARSDAGARVPDRQELDLTVDYRIEDGRWRGFWLRVRGAFVRERGAGGTDETQNELRVILNYDVAFL